MYLHPNSEQLAATFANELKEYMGAQRIGAPELAQRVYPKSGFPSLQMAYKHILGLRRGWIYGNYGRMETDPRSLKVTALILAEIQVPADHILILTAMELDKHFEYPLRVDAAAAIGSGLPLEERARDQN